MYCATHNDAKIFVRKKNVRIISVLIPVKLMNDIHDTQGTPRDDASATLRPRDTHPENDDSSKGALFLYTVLALGLALFIRFYVAAPYVVSGSSMEPNFDNWDYLITDRLTYRMEEPERGDVIVFKLPQEPSRSLIKRVVGVPGDTIIVRDNRIEIQNAEHPEGILLDEPYLETANFGGPTGISLTLGGDEFFVMGDNRRVSSDSRTWGVLPRENIVGRVLLRLFPLSKLGVLPAEARYLQE